MTKTTIYLDDSSLRDLKRLAAHSDKTNVADLIRSAIFDFLRKTKAQKKSLSHLSKLLRQKPRKNAFGDGVEFQRNLRDDWNKE